MAKISFLVVSFNTKEVIGQCIEAIVANVGNYSYEVIVVDNASTDGSIDYIKDQIVNKQSFSTNSKNITLIENSENLGFAKANNQAYQRATGDFIFLLNPDTVLQPNCVGILLQFLQSRNDVCMVAPRLYFENGTIQASCYKLPTFWGAVKEYIIGIKNAYNKYYPKTTNPVAVEAVVGAAMLLPKTIVENLGVLFDEKFYLYYEDIDLCKRVQRLGCKIYYLPQASVIHHHGISSQKLGEWPQQQNLKSAKLYFGALQFSLITIILKYGQKWQKLVEILKIKHKK